MIALFALALTTQVTAPTCEIPEPIRQALIEKLGPDKPFVFCLPQDQPIRRVEPFHQEWLSQAGHPSFSGKAHPGQFFTFQIGILGRNLGLNLGPRNLFRSGNNTPTEGTRPDQFHPTLRFSDLKGPNGTIPNSQARCISLGGIDMHGKPFTKSLQVPSGALQPLWCGWDIPASAKGAYQGTIILQLAAGQEQRIPFQIKVEGMPVKDGGADDPNSLSRLKWLDSKAGEGDSITKPFIPMKITGRTIRVLGRELTVADNGLPSEIVTHFTPANTAITKTAKPVIASPFRFVASEGGKGATLESKLRQVRSTPSLTTWRSSGRLGGFSASLEGRLDYTGSGQLAIHLAANRDMDLDDIRLEIPYAAVSSRYMMGLNRQGGLRPASHEWHWDVKKHQDCFWLGDVNAGLMVRLKDSNYRRPLLNIYYSFLPLTMPNSWGNSGKGGVRILQEGKDVIVRSYCGPRIVKRGQKLDFIADIYLTPFRTIDTEKQWSTRFVHPHPSRDPKPVDDALALADPKKGPNVLNVHQATYYNPYINYPYSADSFADFTNLVKRAHDKGIRARVYYTTREITQNMPELYALHSLNGEVVFPGPGKNAKTLINPNGPNPWLVQNLGSDFVPAWVDHVGGKYAQDDISVITTPDSRWNNFYLEGLRWMVQKAKIDGVYIDDTALDASSLQRARRILEARPDPVIDLHTWNHFNEWAGYANNLNLYMEVLPYLDRLWLGEGFSANDAPWDYWLVEMSGLPFGLMSEMLDSPNPIRGLVFGETGRLGWSGDPRPVWQLFDEYKIQGTEMIPFFSPANPVQTHDPQLLATVYRGMKHAIVVLGNWSGKPTKTRLDIDWRALGLDPASHEVFAPEVQGMQKREVINVTQELNVPKEGLILVVRQS